MIEGKLEERALDERELVRAVNGALLDRAVDRAMNGAVVLSRGDVLREGGEREGAAGVDHRALDLGGSLEAVLVGEACDEAAREGAGARRRVGVEKADGTLDEGRRALERRTPVGRAEGDEGEERREGVRAWVRAG